MGTIINHNKLLEEAAKEYAEDNTYMTESMHDSEIPDCMQSTADAFKAGANWMKEHLLEDSESAEIGYWNQRGLSIRLDKDLENLGFGEDTKVKVLIIKEDEE